MPVQELAQVLALPFRDGAVVGHGIGHALEVHHAHVGGEVEGGDVVLLGDEVHHPVEGDLSADEGLHIDVDVLQQHGVEAHQQVQVAQDHAVHHHEDVVGLLEPGLDGVRNDQLQGPAVPDPAGAELRDEFDQDFLHGRETGVVVQMVPAAFVGLQDEVLPVRHEGRERVDAQGFFGPQGGFPGHEVLPQGRAQAEFGQFAGRRVEEGAFKVDVSAFLVQFGHLAHDFPVPVDVGRIVPDAVRPFGPADIDAGGVSGRGQGGFRIAVRIVHQGALDARGHDFPVELGHGVRAGLQPDTGREGLQETGRGVLLRGGQQVVLMPDRQADRRLRAGVAEHEGRGGSSRKPRPGGQLQLPFRRRNRPRQGLVGLLVQNLHPVRNAGGGGGVEDGQQAGARHPGRAFLAGIDRRIGHQPVGTGGCRDRNPEGSGAAAFQQADFGRTDRSALGNELQVRDGAFVRIPAVSVQAGQGTPDGVTGDIDVPVGGHIDALHGNGGPRQDAGGEGQEYDCQLFHQSFQKSGLVCVPPAAMQS